MISIIIPAYNSAATIVEALESVMAQSLWDVSRDALRVTSDEGSGKEVENAPYPSLHSSPFEVIVVDDCSTDNTEEVVRNWITHHFSPVTRHPSPVTLHRLPSNAGPAAARNAGIREARGEWIAFLDADDAWLPDKMERQLACAEQWPDVVLWCGGWRTLAETSDGVRVTGREVEWTADGVERGRRTTDNGRQESQTGRHTPPGSVVCSPLSVFCAIPLEEFARHNCVATSTVLVRREILEQVGGFDEQFRGPEDYDLWMRVAAARDKGRRTTDEGQRTGRNILCSLMSNVYGPKSEAALPSGIGHVNAALILYRETPGSLSRDDRRFLPQVIRVLDKAFGPGGALASMPEWRPAAICIQFQQASWMAFERGDRSAAVRLWARAYLNFWASGRKVHRKWWRILARYAFGKRPDVMLV